MTKNPTDYVVTYNHAGEEDPGELVLVLVVLVLIKADHFSLDPWVAHRLEDCHAEPEPNVQGGKSTAEISAALKALHARSDCHIIVIDLSTNFY